MFKRIIMLALMMLSVASVADAQTGTWSGRLDVHGTPLSIVFHLDGDQPTADSPDQGAEGIPIEVEKGIAGKVTVRIPSLAAIYEGQWLINKIVGTFRQMNVSFPLTLTPGENRPKRPQTPVGPFPYATEEVSFINGDFVLNGTLTLPDGYSRETPVLLMVTGSGQQDRDETIFEHRPFAVIAYAFARAGIATLRYDDRGFKGYSGDMSDCTVEDFKADALAGIDMLRMRFDHVGILGHSEGGTIAFMLAADQKVDFMISLAGMAVSGAEALVAQNRISLLSAGIPETITDTYCNLIAEAFNVRVNGGRMPVADDYDLPDALKQNYLAVLAQIQTPYMIHFLSLDIRPLLGQITCPVLALNGTKDVQVDHEANLEPLREGLVASGDAVVESVEGVNHLFQRCSTGAVTEYRTIEETMSPDVLLRMVRWLQDITEP